MAIVINPANGVPGERYTDRCDMLVGPCACGAWHGAKSGRPLEALDSTPLNSLKAELLAVCRERDEAQAEVGRLQSNAMGDALQSPLNDLRDKVHEIAVGKGWWGGGDSSWRRDFDVPQFIASKLALIHSEVSEALEEVRDGQMETYIIEGKPMGLPIELADVVIRVLDLAGALGIDMDAAIQTKIEYDRTRTHRHGGRLL